MKNIKWKSCWDWDLIQGKGPWLGIVWDNSIYDCIIRRFKFNITTKIDLNNDLVTTQNNKSMEKKTE